MYPRVLTSLLSVFLLACGSAAAPEPAAPPSPVPGPGAETTTVAPLAEPIPAPTSSPTTAVQYQPSDDRSSCQGTDLDLGTLARQAMCNLSKTAEPLPTAGLVASLASEEITVVEGRPSEIRLILTNTTDAPMDLEFDASCRFLNMLELAIYKRSMRMDRVSMQCDVDAKVDCSGHVVGVTIDAGGTAFFRLAVPARVALLAKECEEFPSRVLSPGAYTMRLRTAFAKDPLLATMNIKRLLRLPRKQCKSYAKKVAEVAEPQAALRAGVAKALAAQCRRKQPVQDFADCQLEAKTAAELKKCDALKGL